MNSFWNKNLELFKNRFPSLFEQLKEPYSLDSDINRDFNFWTIEHSKSGELTAKENSLYLHSAYNPLREAQSVFKAHKGEKTECALFLSMGLGYAPIEWAQNAPDDTIIIVEPQPLYFFAALNFTDFSALFKHKKLILLLNADISVLPSLVESAGGFFHTAVIENKAQTNHAKEYFSLLNNLIERNRQKERINTATLEKFSTLWLKNSCRNLKAFSLLDGVNFYKDKCPQNLPCLLVSAGPSLSEILPFLKELKNRCLVVAVDTALRALLKAKVEPDFIVLTDPQYYAYCHIAGLKSPSSVLITESVAWPAVYRFNCRKIVLTSSLFPLGKYFEKRLGTKGELGAGGSVSTSAWDFCRLIGAKKIYCAGLDLGYPRLESHIRGSLFEEKAHRQSFRLKTSEQMLSTSLFHANTTKAMDYDGNEIFTDDKMKMFAWWFESQNQKYSQVESFSLCKKSLAIPGFKYKNVNELLCKKEKLTERNLFFSSEQNTDSPAQIQLKEKKFTDTLTAFLAALDTMQAGAEKAESECQKILLNKNPQKEELGKAVLTLEETDKALKSSNLLEIAGLVFPTEAHLEKIFLQEESKTAQSILSDRTKTVFLHSKIIYGELLKAVKMYKKYINKSKELKPETR